MFTLHGSSIIDDSVDETDLNISYNGETKLCQVYDKNDAHVAVRKTRSIYNLLKQYPLDDEIRVRANIINGKMKVTFHRSKKLVQYLFYCVYCAYRELGLHVNPQKLGEMFKLTSHEITQANLIYCCMQTKYEPKDMEVSPLDYIPDYCQDLGLSKGAEEEIIKIGREVIEKYPPILEKPPRNIAAGIISYYMKTEGVVLNDPKHLAAVAHLSPANIREVFKIISVIYNSDPEEIQYVMAQRGPQTRKDPPREIGPC